MIKLEHVVLASPEQMEFIIEGMRNPMNSWEMSDSKYGCGGIGYCPDCLYHDDCDEDPNNFELGDKDLDLMKRLSSAGTDHRKFMRMMPVYVRITAPLYWWKEFDTYKVGTVRNSCSTMHKIQAKEFTLDDFSGEYLMTERVGIDSGYGFPRETSSIGMLQSTIDMLNYYRKCFVEDGKTKDDWWQLIQLLPSSYNQTANVMLNYEVLANIYVSRKNHKLDEWVEFCKWIETLPYSELITSPGGGISDER